MRPSAPSDPRLSPPFLQSFTRSERHGDAEEAVSHNNYSHLTYLCGFFIIARQNHASSLRRARPYRCPRTLAPSLSPSRRRAATRQPLAMARLPHMKYRLLHVPMPLGSPASAGATCSFFRRHHRYSPGT